MKEDPRVGHDAVAAGQIVWTGSFLPDVAAPLGRDLCRGQAAAAA
jgi:hypothetical protein